MSDKNLKELDMEIDKYYRSKVVNTHTKHFLFNSNREIDVIYDYRSGRTYEVETDNEVNFFDMLHKKNNRIDVSLTEDEYRFLNLFRAMTGKQQNELYSKLQDVTLQFITEKN